MAGDHEPWRKSSYSAGETNCVEVAPLPHETGIRDSKNVSSGELRVRRKAWRAFVRKVAAS